MALGSLCDVLKEHEASEMETFCLKEKINKPGFFTLLTLLKMCKDAAAGMTYLSKLNIVHRDLACRNLLVKKSDEEVFVGFSSSFSFFLIYLLF
jgi:serine/threonine protein kinase